MGLLRTRPVTFYRNLTQISRCEKKLFFKQITTFTLKNMEVRLYIQKKTEIFRVFEHMKKVFNKIGELVEDDGTYFPA